MMTEADVKGDLMYDVRRHARTFVAIRHEDKFTAAVPDISLTGNGRTTWWEVKLMKDDDRDIWDRGIQSSIMERLEVEGFAAYIIYDMRDDRRSVHIMSPSDVKMAREQNIMYNMFGLPGYHSRGFDHKWVTSYMLGAHRNADNVGS